MRPECYQLSPILKKLSEKEMLFVILSTDYQTIYRQFPEQDRIRRAMFHVYDDYMPELLKKQYIIDAINAYKGLQYDADFEEQASYDRKLEHYLKRLNNDDITTVETEKILKIISQIKSAKRAISEKILEKIQDEGQLKGGKKLSFLEKLHKNEKLYKAVQTTKPKKLTVIDEDNE